MTGIASGTDQLGGPIISNGTLSVDVGSAANKVVQENANAQIAQAGGSTSLPGYSFAGNTGSGLANPASNLIALVTNGTALSPRPRLGLGSICSRMMSLVRPSLQIAQQNDSKAV